MMQEPRPLVTIAIPTYNRADSYLPGALKSAVNQTYPHLEIIVSDNCSTDSTETFIAGFADPRIRYFKQTQNIGATNNFAFCLQQARGKYFLLLHDDDLIDPDLIETCIKAVPPGPDVGVIFAGTRIIDGDGKVIQEVPNRGAGAPTDAFLLGWLAGKTCPYLCSTLFHTARLREIGGLQSKHHHLDDAMAEVQLAGLFGRIDVQDIKASFRRHDSKGGYLRLASASEVKNWCDDSLQLLDLMCKLAPKRKALVRQQGMQTFSNLCYQRAALVKSPFQRLLGNFIVFKMFHYRYLPPSVLHFLNKISFQRIRRVKSKVKQLLSVQLRRL